MKKLIYVLLAVTVLLTTPTVLADSKKDQQKERKEQSKESKKKLNEKVSKAAKKEAKRLEKQGWVPSPGTMPIEKQEDKAFLMQYEEDDYGNPKYIFGSAESTAKTFDAARLQAITMAKGDIASKIETHIAGLIETSVANSQLSREDAETVTKIITARKEIIEQKLGRVLTVVDIRRDTSDKNVTVQIVLAYSLDEAKAVTRAAIQADLEQRGDMLQNKLDKILGL